jgi:hypothetical protein
MAVSAVMKSLLAMMKPASSRARSSASKPIACSPCH